MVNGFHTVVKIKGIDKLDVRVGSDKWEKRIPLGDYDIPNGEPVIEVYDPLFGFRILFNEEYCI